MSELRPATDADVRLVWGLWFGPHGYDRFGRWLAAHDVEVAARALREASAAMDADPDFRDPLRLKADWLRARADRIEREAVSDE